MEPINKETYRTHITFYLHCDQKPSTQFCSIFRSLSAECKGKWLKELPINIEFLQEEIEYQISEELSRHLSDNGLSLSVLDSAFLALLFIKYRVTSIENDATKT